ncbi:shufflon system plasmid conjugative transfer pilus tip adhesin PilV, partial [Yersinia sp. Marseille-Q3913]
NISGLGGYIWPANQAIGANGSWTVNLPDYGLSGQVGRLAVMLSSDSLGSDSEAGDRLYRFEVNGRPDLNKMHTAIDMGSNDINNARNLNAQNGQFSGDVSATNGKYSGDLTADQSMTANKDIRSNEGWIVTRNNKGWMNETYGGGFYMDDYNTIKTVNNKGIYTGGLVKGGTVQLEQVNVAGTSCPENGRLSRDAVGATLSCQSGVWKSSSAMQRNSCVWYYFGGGGQQSISCPVGQYMGGFSRYMENDWKETGHFQIECCS